LYVDGWSEQKLTQGEAHILALLAESSPATVAELHRGLAHKRSTLTSILDRLVERKLVTRTVGKSDRRTFVVSLTSEGGKAARRIHQHLLTLEHAVSKRVKSADVAGFKAVITALEEEARLR
jgi:DNA-binding MarR family transcriptional regulator